MPLRDLPTESAAADALLRVEELEQRRARRTGDWYPLALVGCAAAILLAQLLPGFGASSCYLWRQSTEVAASRTLAGLLPLAAVALVLLDRMLPEQGSARRRSRAWGTTTLGGLTIIGWAGLLSQGRTGCDDSPAVLGTLLLGCLATVIATLWTRRPATIRPVLVRPSDGYQGLRGAEPA